MARAQLRLLLVLGTKDITDAVQELEVVLLRVGGQATSRGQINHEFSRIHIAPKVQSKGHDMFTNLQPKDLRRDEGECHGSSHAKALLVCISRCLCILASVKEKRKERQRLVH